MLAVVYSRFREVNVSPGKLLRNFEMPPLFKHAAEQCSLRPRQYISGHAQQNDNNRPPPIKYTVRVEISLRYPYRKSSVEGRKTQRLKHDKTAKMRTTACM